MSRVSQFAGAGTVNSNVVAFMATPTSANLAAAVSDETGSGAVVFAISPALTGSPMAPTQTAGDNSTKIATTAYVANAVSAAGPSPTANVSIHTLCGGV